MARLLALVAVLAVAFPPPPAQAYELPTSATGTTLTLPSGLTATLTRAGATTVTATSPSTIGSRGYQAADFPTGLPTGTPAYELTTNFGGCPVTTGNCNGSLGSITITFSQPLSNPLLHIAGLGDNYTNAGTSTNFHAILTLTTTGVVLSKVGGSNLSVSTTQITTIGSNVSSSCTSNGTNGATSTAGCGTVRLAGIGITSVTFNVTGSTVRASGTGTGTVSTSAGDAFVLTVTASQDYGDAPAAYEASAARHLTSNLRLGSGLTPDNETTPNGTTSPNAGASATGDSDDGIATAFANAVVGVPTTYTKTVALSGVTQAATLCGWVDFNRNSAFESSEQQCQPVASGQTSATFTVTGTPASAGASYARFRLGYTAAQVQSPTGAADSGEVEDYPVTFVAAAPALTLTKSASRTSTDSVGQITTYTFTATNTGNVTINNVTITDPKPGLSTLSCTPTQPANLAPGAVLGCTATRATTQADLTAGGTITNTATADGTPAAGTPTPATATATVAVNQNPSILIVKSASPSSFTAAGQTISYTLTVTNTGNVPLSNTQVTDSKLIGLSCTPGQGSTLNPGATKTCTGTYLTTQADVDNGSATNTASVAGTPPSSGANATDVDTLVIPGPTRTPDLSLTKTAIPASYAGPGETSTYTFVATNTGNVTLTTVTISDPMPGLSTLACTPAQPTQLAPGDSLTCTATRTTTQADVDAGSVANTATVVGTPPSGPAISRTKSATVTGPSRAPAIDLVKTAAPTTVTAAGEVVSYTFTATNTGNVTLTGVNVTDPKPGLSALSCTPSQPTSLAPGAVITCTATRATTQADINAGTISNTGTATGISPTGSTVSDAGTATVTATRTGSVSLVKTASPDTYTAVGETIGYSFTATNTGNTTLSNLVVTDPMPGLSPLACSPSQPATRDPGESLVCTASRTITQADLDAGQLDNTATVNALAAGGQNVSATGSEQVTGTRTPSLSLTKSATPGTVAAAGQVISYTFVATNTGNTTLHNVTVADPLPGLSPLSCAPAPPATLAPGDTLDCAANYTTTQADIDAAGISNTATARGDGPGGDPANPDDDLTATDSETVPSPDNPEITLTKTASPTTVSEAGDVVTYTFAASNTGNVTLNTVTITDPMVGLTGLVCNPVQPALLAPGATLTCTASRAATQADVDIGTITNTATATATSPVGTVVTDDDPAIVTAAADPELVVSKVPSRTFVDTPGQAVDYTFVAQNIGNVTLTGVEITDPLPGLTPLSCTPPQPVTLEPDDISTCTASYTTSQADIDAGGISNTATATGNPPSGGPVTDTASVTVPAQFHSEITLAKSASPTAVTSAGQQVSFSFVATNTGNVSLTAVQISDNSLSGLSGFSCDIDPPVTLAPGSSLNCAASYVATQDDLDAGSIVNLATAQGTAPDGAVTDDDDAVVLAVPAAAVELVKTASPTTLDAVGDQVDYTFVATNIGDSQLTGVAITDPLPGLSPLTCTPAAPADLEPGETLSCAASYTVDQADLNAGAISNTASVSGVPSTGDPTPVTDSDDSVVGVTQQPSISLAKTAVPAAVAAAGDPITYTFQATNTGNVTLTDVTVADPLPNLSPIVCDVGAPIVLDPGEDVECTASYTASQADADAGEITNTATASGQPPVNQRVSDSDPAVVTIASAPSITLNKTAVPLTINEAGEVLTYSLTATNTGNVTLTDVVISDSQPGLSPLTCTSAQPASLAPGEDLVCTGDYTATQADVDAGQIVNDGFVTARPPTGLPVSAEDEAAVTAAADPSIALAKTAAPAVVGRAGDEVTYTFVASNTGNVTLTDVTISDERPGLSSLTCDQVPPATLPPGEPLTCTATYAATQTDIDAGSFSNLAGAAGTDPSGTTVTDEDGATVVAPASPPFIELTKTGSPRPVSQAGDVVTYALRATNVGNVTLTGVTITDSVPGLSPLTCTTPQPATLTPDDELTCTASYAATQADLDLGRIENTAVVTATRPDGVTVTDNDTETIAAPADPRISLSKTADRPVVAAVGDVVTYTFVASNTGNVSLGNVVIDDALADLSDLACDRPAPVVLAPAEVLTCTATYSATQHDIDSGGIDNTATTTAEDPQGDSVTDSDAEVVTASATPAIALAKTADPVTVGVAGEEVTYTFAATNTGNVTLTGVRVADPLPGLSAPICDRVAPVTLAPDEVMTCAATYRVSQTDLDSGSILNTALVSGDAPGGDPQDPNDDVTDTDDAVVAATPEARIGLVKTADPVEVDEVGEVVRYTFVATNTGHATLNHVAISDPLPGLSALACDPAAPAVLAPGDELSCTATYRTTQADLDVGKIDNRATVAGEAPGGDSGDPADDVTAEDGTQVVVRQQPQITLANDADPTRIGAAGQTVTFRLVATNTGNITLTNARIDAPLPGLSPLTCDQPATLAPGESLTCEATYVATQADADAGRIVNVATVTATPADEPGLVVVDVDQAVVTVGGAPAIELVKTATGPSTFRVGEVVSYGLLATNTGTVPLTGVTLTDSLGGLSELDCDRPRPLRLEPAEAVYCRADYRLTQIDLDRGEVANTASVTGDPVGGGEPVDDDDSVVLDVAPDPSIDLVKTVDDDSVRAGDSMTYTFVATNTGNVTLGGVLVSDPLTGLSALRCDPAAPTVLAPGASLTCTATYRATTADARRGEVVNTATVTGTPLDGALAVTAAAGVEAGVRPATAVQLPPLRSLPPPLRVLPVLLALANTGGPNLIWLPVAGLLALAGAATLVSARRRRADR